MIKRYLILSLVGLFTLSGCFKDKFNTDKIKVGSTYEPDIASAILFANVTAEDIINEVNFDTIIIDEGGLVTLLYNGQAFSAEAQDFIQIPNQQFNTSFSLDAAEVALINAAPTGSMHNYSTTETINVGVNNDHRLYEVLLKNTSLTWTASSDFPHEIIIDMSIPSLTANGNGFSENVVISSVTSPMNQSTDISGHTFDLTDNGQSFNTFDIQLDITVVKGGPSSPIDELSFDIDITPNYSHIIGFLGDYNIFTQEDTVEIDLFEKQNGEFYSEDPTITVDVYNSFGFNLEGFFPLFKVRNRTTAQDLDLTGNGFPNPFNILGPNQNQMGETVKNSFVLNDGNSNIKPAIAMRADRAFYQVEGRANVGADPNTTINFVLDSSRFTVDYELELPFEGWARDFIIDDTVEFKIGEDIDILQEALFRIYMENAFPIDIVVKSYLLDATYAIVDSLTMPNNSIAAAPVDADGVVIPGQEVSANFDIVYTGDRIERLESVRFISVQAEFNSIGEAQESNVKILNTNSFFVQIGMRTTLKVEIE